MAGFFRYYLPLLFYAVFVFLISSLSKPSIPYNIESNFLHYPEYAIFSFLVLRALHFGRKKSVSPKNIIYAIFISIIFGIFDEIHQAFVPERVPELNDLFRDFIGSVIGIILFVLFNQIFVLRGKSVCRNILQ